VGIKDAKKHSVLNIKKKTTELKASKDDALALKTTKILSVDNSSFSKGDYGRCHV